jgi:hypothetical protein
MGDPFEERRIESWAHLIQTLDELKGAYIFRGMGSAEWPLQSSLERYVATPRERIDAERSLIFEFKRRAHDYIDAGKEPTAEVDWLALMQHFGAPTRLVDFTRSPYVAALFAYEEVGQQERALWAIDQALCFSTAGSLVVAAEPGAATPDRQAPGDWWAGATASARLQIGPSPWPGQGVFPYIPDRVTGRLAIQQGLFLWPNDVEVPFMENLVAVVAGGGVIKIVLPGGELRGQALEDLRYMNITRASLFPGLDGFATSLRTLLVRETPSLKGLRHAIAPRPGRWVRD